MSNRIIRGFSRLGIGAAVLTAIYGLVPNIYAQIDDPPPTGLNELVRHRTPALYAAKTACVGLGITALAALAVFGFFRGLGWIIAGFARD